MPTQNPAMSSHNRQLPRLENTSFASLATTSIPSEYQKIETMRLQHPAHANGKVIKVRAIHHYVGNDNGQPFSTVEVELKLDGGQIKHTTMRYSEVKDMKGGKAELANFGSSLDDPILDSQYIKSQGRNVSDTNAYYNLY